MSKIAIIGECMVEISGQPFNTMQQNFGGDSMNTAIYIKKVVGDVVDVQYVSAMGEDSLSTAMIEKWQSYGIDTSSVLINPEKHAGLYLIQNDDDGERTFQYWRNDSAAKYMVQHAKFPDVVNKLADVDAIYLSGISLAILPVNDCKTLLVHLKKLAESGVNIIFDSNYRPTLWSSILHCQQVYNEVYALSSLALVTFDDEHMLWGDTSIEKCRTRLHQHGVNELVIKDGANGCQYSRDSQKNSVLIFPTQKIENVVDTTAAGDSFNAGFLAYWLQSCPIKQCADAGNQLAGQVIQQKGAIVEIELEDMHSVPH